MSHPLRRADRFLAVQARPGPSAPELPRWRAALWRLLPKRRVPAFYASPYMVPPLGACGAADLAGRPGAMTSYQEVGRGGDVATVYEACCPGCGGLVARLDPHRQPIRGGDGPGGYGCSLTALMPVWFRGCCGWYGHLRAGAWVGRRPSLDLRAAWAVGASLIDGVNTAGPPRTDGD